MGSKFLYKETESKYCSSLCRLGGFCSNHSTLTYSVEAATENMKTNACISIKLYLWILMFEFCIIFRCHKTLIKIIKKNYLKI